MSGFFIQVHRVAVWALTMGWLLCAPRAQAFFLPIPRSLAQETLSESVPTVLFSPNDFTAEDFTAEWEKEGIPGVELKVGPRSFEWVRVLELLLIPRGELVLRISDVEGGRVSYAGFSHAVPSAEGSNAITMGIPVALISGEPNAIEIVVLRGGKELRGRAILRFKPRPTPGLTDQERFERRILRDPSCSRFGLEAEAFAGTPFPEDSWAYIGCRMVVAQGAEHRTSALELYVFWDNVGRNVQTSGITIPQSIESLWTFKMGADPGALRLALPGSKAGLTLRYSIPKRLHLASLGLGVGPYDYAFSGPGHSESSTIPLLTFYGAYFFTETIRIVAFDAMALNKYGYNDLGLYVVMENFRFLDRRIGINILLGGHVLAFQTPESTYARMGAPQGMELIYTDVLGKGMNLSLGGFLYPLIDGKSYNNLWLRWGGKVFGELNYISWQERIYGERVYSKSVGITVGFPVGKFW